MRHSSSVSFNRLIFTWYGSSSCDWQRTPFQTLTTIWLIDCLWRQQVLYQSSGCITTLYLCGNGASLSTVFRTVVHLALLHCLIMDSDERWWFCHIFCEGYRVMWQILSWTVNFRKFCNTRHHRSSKQWSLHYCGIATPKANNSKTFS